MYSLLLFCNLHARRALCMKRRISHQLCSVLAEQPGDFSGNCKGIMQCNLLIPYAVTMYVRLRSLFQINFELCSSDRAVKPGMPWAKEPVTSRSVPDKKQ